MRERIVRAAVSRIATAVSPVVVLRQPVIAIPRDRTPAVVITVESDAPVKRANDRIERELIVRLVGLARDQTDGYLVADDLICRAHVALLADVTLGGLALGIQEAETDWQAEDADIEAIAIPASYRITYRTLVSDISQGG
ncbi:MAG: hypothetical protein QMD73_09985 [Rhodocyclaceae bacterium]|nr:hypothetical protein [Rhodocyclaceae bacterium]